MIAQGQTVAMTIGMCAAKRHQICGPADAFPPLCDGCAQEKLAADAERYRWLRDRAGNAIMEELMKEFRPDHWDQKVDRAMACSAETVTGE